MRKIIFFIPLVLAFFFINPNLAHAKITAVQNPKPVCQDSKTLELTFVADLESGFVETKPYRLAFKTNSGYVLYGKSPTYINNKKLELQINIKNNPSVVGNYNYVLFMGNNITQINDNTKLPLTNGFYSISPENICAIGLEAKLKMDQQEFQAGPTAKLYLLNANPNSDYVIWFEGEENSLVNGKPKDSQFLQQSELISVINDIPVNKYTFVIPVGNPGEKKICLKHGKTTAGIGLDNCETFIDISIIPDVPKGTPVPVQSNEIGAPEGQSCDPNDPKQACPAGTFCTYNINEKGIYSNICLAESSYSDPVSSAVPVCGKFEGKVCKEVNTAIGPISTEPQGFVRSIFNVVLGLAGGIALILIIISGYKFMASGGNPEATKAATEQLTSAIIGLLFIIFSFVILQIIGVDILKIPGFNP